MRRHRNARYAPESLERKLNPSTMGIAPTPAVVGTMSMSPDYIPMTTMAAPTAPTFPSDYLTTTTLAAPSTTSSDFLAGDELPTPPGEGPAPTLPPLIPTGPIGPA